MYLMYLTLALDAGLREVVYWAMNDHLNMSSPLPPSTWRSRSGNFRESFITRNEGANTPGSRLSDGTPKGARSLPSVRCVMPTTL